MKMDQPMFVVSNQPVTGRAICLNQTESLGLPFLPFHSTHQHYAPIQTISTISWNISTLGVLCKKYWSEIKYCGLTVLVALVANKNHALWLSWVLFCSLCQKASLPSLDIFCSGFAGRTSYEQEHRILLKLSVYISLIDCCYEKPYNIFVDL